MVQVDNYSINGCSIYKIFRNFPLYGVWITSSVSGTTKLMLMEEEKFLNFTNIKKPSPSKSEITKSCEMCTHRNCTVKECSSIPECLSKLIYGNENHYRKYKRYPLSIKGFLLTENEIDEDLRLEIKDISVGGIQCSLKNSKNNLDINNKVTINICTCDTKNESDCSKCLGTETPEKAIEGKVVWTLDDKFGIELIEKQNVRIVNNLIEKINREIQLDTVTH